ncbi:MAG TPA: type II CAAX endopeptidase family protein [Symbiobacteriaceae bacterium]|nr:type II CAAX endopeptidase family protein [Symbiobacteriaceae bacterium]
MHPHRTMAPVRGALFFTVALLLAVTIGVALQQALGLAGIILKPLLLFAGLAAGWAVYAEHERPATALRLRPVPLAEAGKSLLLGLVSALLAQALSMLAVALLKATGGQIPQLYRDLTYTPFALALVTRALVPALSEEIAFRGYLQYSLQPLSARAAVLVSALLFGAFHLSLIRLIPLTLLGLAFAAASQRSGSVLPAMIMHFANNALALVLTYYVTIPEVSVPVLLAAVPPLALLAWWLFRWMVPTPDAEEQVAPTDRKAVVAGLSGCLVPAVLLYVYYVVFEWHTVWP